MEKKTNIKFDTENITRIEVIAVLDLYLAKYKNQLLKEIEND